MEQTKPPKLFDYNNEDIVVILTCNFYNPKNINTYIMSFMLCETYCLRLLRNCVPLSDMIVYVYLCKVNAFYL